MVKAKICGITRLEDAELATELGAWALGFILWPRLARAPATPAVAAGIARELRRRVETVGVFVNPPLDEIAHGRRADRLHARAAARRRGAGVLRRRRAAHGREGDQGRARGLRWPICSSSRASTPTSTCSTRPRAGLRGGSGKTWDWALAARHRSPVPVILSGGLHAGNVAEGIAAVHPWGVDVASGTEAAPGVKDPAKLEAFLAAVGETRRAARPGRGRSAESPDERAATHRFGPYGGQYVPETLMPALDELEAAWLAAREDAGLPRASWRACCATSSGARRRSTTRGASRRRSATPVYLKREDLHPHRRAQDQQRARPGAAGPAHGQDADHRRDRRGPARRRDGDRLRAARPRVRRLHGHRGHAPPAAQRAAHGAARRDASRRSRPGARTLKEAVIGGDPRLGRQRRATRTT